MPHCEVHFTSNIYNSLTLKVYYQGQNKYTGLYKPTSAHREQNKNMFICTVFYSFQSLSMYLIVISHENNKSKRQQIQYCPHFSKETDDHSKRIFSKIAQLARHKFTLESVQFFYESKL